MKADFLYPNMEVEMLIKYPEDIVYLGVTTKEFLEEYFILLEKSICENVDTVLLWTRLLDAYLVNECNLKRSKSDSCILKIYITKGSCNL